MLINIVYKSHAVFVPGPDIHNHILLLYELIRGYNKKGGMPSCMLLMDFQKAFDTMD